jgi:hypothetical protein
MCFFRSVKQAKIAPFAIVTFALCHVLFGRFTKAHAQKPAFVIGTCAFKVLCVCLCAYTSQVVVRIVSRIAVNMVNIFWGPSARHIQNSTTMRVVFVVINRYFDVPVGVFPPGNVARFGGSAGFAPRKTSRVWAILQYFAQTGCGKIFNSHDDPLSVVAVRSAGAAATAPRFAII